jgi:uncharacterized BrkB/YihY/UPF0761 family membrane protein
VSLGRIVREYLFVLTYVLTFVLFIAISQGAEWSEQIDELDGQYTAFSHVHILSTIVFLVLFLVSAFLIWLRDRRMPPPLLLPVFAVVTAVLVLFGQDPDSMAKVFTETTTWSIWR